MEEGCEVVAHYHRGRGRAEALGAAVVLGADLTVEWTGATPVPPECLAPYRAVVVFRVPASALPEHPTVNGEQPDPAGP